MVEPLDVRLHGETVGRLDPAKNGARFSYSDELLSMHQGEPLLSTALPVNQETFDAQTTRNWFTGLLPEDARLAAYQRFFGIEPDDYPALLREAGWECAGAVEILPSEVRVPPSSPTLHVNGADLTARLESLPNHPYDTPSTMRLSLGGYQNKLCVVLPLGICDKRGIVDIDGADLPLDGSPSTHILKPQSSRFPHLLEAEAWGLAVASAATPTAKAAIARIGNSTDALLIERFDRRCENDKIVRVHQEDCAQALGLSPSGKYASTSTPKKSDPTFRGIAELLMAYSPDPFADLEGLLAQMTINVALGNTDAHAKNYALLHPSAGTVGLAPLYDVVPALDLTPKMHFMGMRIAGKIRIDRVERGHFVEETSAWGLASVRAERILTDVGERLREGIAAANILYPQAAERHASSTLKRLDQLGL